MKSVMESPVRVRFAPSPTGPLHIGGLRTALYNFLFAKKNQGTFILRIEDTDQGRLVPGAEQYIAESLAWLGINPDESPYKGGPCGPYRQSERKTIYQEYAKKLIDAGKAYYAFDTPEALECMRQRLKEAKVASPQYNVISREWMKNSLTLPANEVKARIQAGDSYVIRCKLPHKEIIRFYDQVKGWIKVESATLDDKILIKSDGMATYHLANIVDDYLMHITHVIRGEEWLPSAPLHVLLYQYFGWQDVMPQFVHLPLLLKPEGHGKLSKRDADEHGFPIFPIGWDDLANHTYTVGFREKGYLPEAMVNFLALLGWSPIGHQEFFSINELIEAFSLQRIGKSGVKFDIHKANWFNQHYLANLSPAALATYLIQFLKDQQIAYTHQYVEQVCILIKERISLLPDIWEQAKIFFIPPSTYDPAVVEKKWTQAAVSILRDFMQTLRTLSSFEGPIIKQALIDTLQGKAIKLAAIQSAMRLAIMGNLTGPDLMQSIEVMGREETLCRLERAFIALGYEK